MSIAADLSLASVAMQTLALCSRVDKLAAEFLSVAEMYFTLIHEAIGGIELSDNLPLSSSTNEDSIEYIFNIPVGDSTLHKAARDLMKLIQRPLADRLEAVADISSSIHLVSDSLITWMETAIGLAPAYIGAYE
jgi:hypothetical protein